MHYGQVPATLEICDATCAAGLRLIDADKRGGWRLNVDGMSALYEMAEGAAFLPVHAPSGASVNDNAAMAALRGGINQIANRTGAYILM